MTSRHDSIRAVDIGGRRVGGGAPCLIIGEVAQAHDGSLGMAHAFIDAIADAGADAVKFQTHFADAESSAAEPFRTKFSRQDASRFDYWKRMEFSDEQWHGLAAHARDRGVLFLSSPFSLRAVELLRAIGVPAWKVASGEINNWQQLDRMMDTGVPLLLSTGMSAWDEIDRAVARASARSHPIAVMQCTSMYPTPPERVGINVLAEIASRYQVPVGLSDHSGTIFPGLAAVTLGCNLLEVHVTLSRQMFGPDVVASVTSLELAELVRGVRFIESVRAHPVAKGAVDTAVAPLRELFMKSVVARQPLSAGTVLSLEMLDSRKPGTGIPASDVERLVGRRLARAVAAGEFLQWMDVGLSAPVNR